VDKRQCGHCVALCPQRSRAAASTGTALDKPIRFKHLSAQPQGYQQISPHKLGITLSDPNGLIDANDSHPTPADSFRAAPIKPSAFNVLASLSDSFQQARQHKLGISR
jgi:hypothetical protein